VLSVTDPRGYVTTNTYDDARRLLTSTSPPTAAATAGILTTNSYDADGRPLQVSQSSGGSVLRTASTTWSPTGKALTTTDANGNVTRNAYDLVDRLAGVTDAEGHVTQLTYDAVSRPYQTFNLAIWPTALITLTYTPDGKLAGLLDFKSDPKDSHTFTSFAYDGFDRLSTTTYPTPTGGTTTTETFTYDAADNLLTRTNRAGGIFSFTYDTANRLLTKTPPSGPTVSYSYDLASRPTGVGDNSAAIAAAVPPGGNSIAYTTTYTYDALNRPLSAAWDNAPAAATPAGGTLVSFGHSYNTLNKRIGQTASDNTWLSYATGPSGTTSYTANALNQYIAVTGLTPSYDANGNLIGDGTYTFGYDPENRLTSASGAGNSSTYAFDAQGRRKSRTVNGTTTISATDADNREVLEYNGSTGALLRWYAYGLGPNDVLSQMNVAGTRTTFVPDILGSVIGTFDGTGTLTKAAYQPYGGSAAAATPFGFTGQRIDLETGGTYYYRARHYSTTFGRFLQPDPVGYSAGLNLYAYVSNNPLNLLDPFGLCQTAGGCTAFFNQIAGAEWAQSQAVAERVQENPRGAMIEGAVGLGVALGVPAAGALRALGATRIVLDTEALSARAQEIHSVLDPIAQTQRTTAVLSTNTETIVASGVRDLTPAQRALLTTGEIAAKLPTAHAEITALSAAEEAGLLPRALATTRTICPACATVIESLGGKLTSPTTAEFPLP
jgi:RHS repeat-associated protein